MANLELRRALPQDEQAVYELICELEQDVDAMDRTAFALVYAHNAERYGVCYLLAWADDVPVGFGSAHVQQLLHHAGAVAEVQELIASQAARGTGVGRALLRALESWAARQGCAQIEVCCRTSREHSNEFYARQGYRASHYKHVKELEP
jgi:PhnO protein